MINWWGLLSNSIWILALSLALAVVSLAYYESRQMGTKVRGLLNTTTYALPLHIAGGVFCLGMVISSPKWWEIILWIVLIVLFSYQGYINIKYKI